MRFIVNIDRTGDLWRIVITANGNPYDNQIEITDPSLTSAMEEGNKWMTGIAGGRLAYIQPEAKP